MYRQKSFDSESPTLYLVATPIGNLKEMTPRAIEIMQQVEYIAAEDTRNTTKLLNHFEIKAKLVSHHEHNLRQSIPHLIHLMEEGNDLVLVSDAGYPAISDPGYELVQEAIRHQLNVVPISGANACLDALVVSGIAPQPFTFFGFLDHQDRLKRRQLEKYRYHQETMVFYESPYRIEKTLKMMLEIWGDREMALCRELTKRHEEIIRGRVSEILTIAGELKGEMVIVISGSQEEAKTEEEEYTLSVAEQVEAYIQSGMSSRDAIKQVSQERHLKKNEVYQTYLNERKEKE